MFFFTKIFEKYHSLSLQVKAALWFLICSFLQKGISTITTPIFTRLLTTTEYGKFNVFNSWLGIITIFVTLRMYQGSYTQGLVKYEEKRNQYASSMQGLTITLCVIWTGIYLLFKSIINRMLSLTTIQMLAMLVMIWATAVFGYWAAEQRVVLKYKELVYLTIIVSLAKPLLGVILVRAATDKVTARILGLAIVEVVGYAWIFFLQLYRGKKFYDAMFWKRAIILNSPLILHYLSMTVLSSSDRIMISKMVSDDKSGIYSLAYQISQVMTLFSNALNQTITPWIYEKIKKDKAREITGIAYVCLFIVAGANLLLILIGPEVVRFFSPPSYHEAIWVIPPVALSVVFMFYYDLFVKYEFYYEKTHYIMVASTVGAGINVILNFFCIKAFGYIAAAYTTLFCYILYAVAHYVAMINICKRYSSGYNPFEAKNIIIISVLFILIGFMLMATYTNNIVRYGLVITTVIILMIFRNALKKQIFHLVNIRKKAE